MINTLLRPYPANLDVEKPSPSIAAKARFSDREGALFPLSGVASRFVSRRSSDGSAHVMDQLRTNPPQPRGPHVWRSIALRDPAQKSMPRRLHM
ncbi:hypothetical protein CDAR_180251 [Caerostris darwini]|uniref:Uncharacterized protein n=1 Tax=Caerostris darwini TaxID=1538125 RepID=A0AAV4PG91_9ARAC|nr:hypothetical protein CDAR_180251 [Caerostris darwini]